MPRFRPIDAALEASLVAGARAGGTERDAAFDLAYRALREQVFALCLHVAGDRRDAEDAVQEVFLAVHRALPRFRGDARLSTWVYRIALRAALRAKARHRPAEPLGREDAPDVATTGAEAELAARLDARRVQAALARLPAAHRAILSLFAIDGLRHREIAEVLGVPEGTVWSRLHAARKRLAAEMER